MKKLIFLVTLTFVLGLGIAYAGGDGLYNGVTDFSGRSYDTFEIEPIDRMDTASVEGAAPGGVRTEDAELYNAVTDFSGRSYDIFEIEPIDRMDTAKKAEVAAPGGVPAEEELYNGVTDFSGKSYDTFEITR